MAELEVRISKLKSCASNQKVIGRKLNTYSGQVINCGKKLKDCLDVKSYPTIQVYLNQAGNSLEDKAERVKSMGNTLENVIRVYSAGEKLVLGQKVRMQRTKEQNY